MPIHAIVEWNDLVIFAGDEGRVGCYDIRYNKWHAYNEVNTSTSGMYRSYDNAVDAVDAANTGYVIKGQSLLGTYRENGVTKTFTADGKMLINFDGECTLFPSKDQRDWSKFSAPWYKKEIFDPNTLKPFDKVLVFTNGEWTCDFFSHTLSGDIFNKRCMGIGDVNVVIPYNDETKHLVGTTEEAPDYYRYWER